MGDPSNLPLVVLHRTWHTHKLHLLNALGEREYINAARAGLAATVLTMRLTHRGGGLAHFRGRGCLEALLAKVAAFARATVTNVVNRTALTTYLTTTLFTHGHVNGTHRWHAATGVQMQTEMQWPRPLDALGSAIQSCALPFCCSCSRHRYSP